MEGGPAALELTQNTLDYAEANSDVSGIKQLSEVQLLAPVPRPVKIRSFSVYEKHMLQSLDALIRPRRVAGR